MWYFSCMFLCLKSWQMELSIFSACLFIQSIKSWFLFLLLMTVLSGFESIVASLRRATRSRQKQPMSVCLNSCSLSLVKVSAREPQQRVVGNVYNGGQMRCSKSGWRAPAQASALKVKESPCAPSGALAGPGSPNPDHNTLSNIEKVSLGMLPSFGTSSSPPSQPSGFHGDSTESKLKSFKKVTFPIAVFPWPQFLQNWPV